MDAICDYCTHWKRDHSGMGWCRRYPPPSIAKNEDTDWPRTSGFDWCGEFHMVVEQRKPDSRMWRQDRK